MPSTDLMATAQRGEREDAVSGYGFAVFDNGIIRYI
jgi:hypothetical protein